MSQRHGFTLFEIVISLLLLTIGVLTTLALMPAGIKSQQQARFASYASAKVMDMMEMFNCQVPADFSLDGELASPWETTTGSRVMANDLEARLVTTRAGLLPLPTTIANRLDSAGDEIAKLLAAGGRIYYSQPQATLDQAIYQQSGTSRRVASSISEARRMLVGVVGYAQQNSIPVLPWKSWPYYHGYPAPPLASGSYQTASPVNITVDDNRNAEAWLQKMYFTYRKREVGEYGSASPLPWDDPPTLKGCLDYVALAMWYAELRGLPERFRNGTADDADVEANYGNANHVRVLSHLAHATTCLTKWFGMSDVQSTNDLTDPLIVGLTRNLVTGFVIPARTVTVVPSATASLVITRSSTSSPPTREISIDLVKIKNWHQRSLDMIMKHAAHYPYNWGALRPFNRAIMMDVPLLEWDLFPDQSSVDFPLLTGTIKSSGGVAAGTVTARHYRALAPMAITSQGVQTPNPDLRTSDIGKAITFKDETRLANTIFGNINHYTLARPFDPSERCREVVFWMADWQSYEDFETAPSAPVDASKYPLRASDNTFGLRMTEGNGLFQPEAQTSYFNPERNLVFRSDVINLATGADTTSLLWNTPVPGGHSWDEGAYPFEGANQVTRQAFDVVSPAPAVFSGVFGADRNANGVLDRGPLPTSVRQRAVTVARFVVYDPRLPLTMR